MVGEKMCAFFQYCLQNEREAFISDLRPKYILPSLVDDGIITLKEQEEVLLQKTIKHQVIRLLEVLPSKGQEAYDSFVKALKKDNAYPWLADRLLLRGNESKIAKADLDKIYTRLAVGGVPFEVNYLVPRVKYLSQIRLQLKETYKLKRQWIVLHGMVCCGKSVLAAEAVRDAKLFNDCFSDGVFWIAVGNVQNENSLLHRMQILWEKLKHDKQDLLINDSIYDRDEIIYIATKRLKEAISEKNKVLVILDDVWTSDVIAAFDIGCPFLITTRNSRVVDSVSGHSHLIPIDNGLNLQESREFLSQWVKTVPENLPDDVDFIHDYTKGSPQILSAIGGIMAPYGNHLERWKNLRKKLEDGNINSIGKRRGSGDKLKFLIEAVKIIMDNLDEELLTYYQDFAVFQEDIYIPNQVLEIMWDCDRFDVEDIMYELAQKSLIQRKYEPGKDSYMYSIHDIYVDYFKKHCNDIAALHKKVVDQYIKLCTVENLNSYNYGLLPDDGYILHFIGYHLYHANESDLFSQVYFDLNFIQRKLQVVGPSDLLSDFYTYKDCFDNAHLQSFVNFVKKNSYLICEENADIVQLALLESPSSLVHQKAKSLALINPDKFCLEICNHSSLPDLSGLRIKLPLEEIKCAVFSPDSRIIVAGCDKVLKVWNSVLGRELQLFSGHAEIINCCTFNPEGSILATASSDKTVKLWSINTQQLLAGKRGSKGFGYSPIESADSKKNDSSIFTFRAHGEEVLWCAFSPSGDLMISSDCSGTVIIWNPVNGGVELEIVDSEVSFFSFFKYPINCCSFIFGSEMFATASHCLIKIWNYPSGKCEKYFSHNDQLVSRFCFDKDHNLISIAGDSLYMWDINNHESPSNIFKIQSCFLCCFSISNDGLFLSIGTSNSSIIIYNIKLKQQVTTLKGHKELVQSVCYSHEGSKLLSASADGLLIVWDLNKSLSSPAVTLENNLSVHLSDELMIATSDISNCIQVRQGLSGRLIQKSIPDDSPITTCSISKDSSEVVYGTKDGSVKVLVISTGEILKCVSHNSQITYLIHLTNNSFITCSEDTTIRVWKSRGQYIVLEGHLQSVVMCVAYNCNEKLLSCSDDGTCRVWNLNTGKACMVLNDHGGKTVTFCDVSHDEKILASASADCTVKLWSSDLGTAIRTLQCPDCVRCCRFSPKLPTLVTGEDSGSIKLWDLQKEDISAITFGMHSSWVKDIQFSADGNSFVSIAENIKIWNKPNCAQTLALPGALTHSLWVCSKFKTFVILHNSILYILKTVT